MRHHIITLTVNSSTSSEMLEMHATSYLHDDVNYWVESSFGQNEEDRI